MLKRATMGLGSLLLFAEALHAGSIQTVLYPTAIDTSAHATPFAVYVEILDWEDVASQPVNVRVTRIGSGSHFRVWRDSAWVSTSQYASCPSVTLDSTGRWVGWLYLQSEGVSSAEFKAYARKADTTAPLIEEAESHPVMLVDGSYESGWLEGHIYADSLFESGLERVAVLAIDPYQRTVGTYCTEVNGIDDAYPDEPGYFRMSVAKGVIASLEFRSQENEPVEGHTISHAPWVVRGGVTSSIDDSLFCVLVCAGDTFAMASDTVKVPLVIDTTTGLEICAVELSLCFDGTILQFVGPETSNTLAGDASWMVEHNVEADTLYLAMAGSSDLSGSGELIGLTFCVREEAEIGSLSPLHFETLLLNEEEVGPETYGQDGSLRVVSRWGDVSGDGEVHAFDAALILRWVVDSVENVLLPHQLIVADVDLDGQLTAYDGSLILQWIVGHIDELPYPGSKVTAANLWLPDFEGHPGETISVPICLRESKDLFSVEATFSYDSSVLKFMEMSGSLYEQIFFHEHEGGRVRFACMSSEPATGETLAMIHFVVSPDAEEGSTLSLGEVRMNNLPVQSATHQGTFRLVSSDNAPGMLYMNQNHPNPFGYETAISFGTTVGCRVGVKVYNVTGELVRILVDDFCTPGYHQCSWDGKDRNGRMLGSGIYFCTLESGMQKIVRKMALIR